MCDGVSKRTCVYVVNQPRELRKGVVASNLVWWGSEELSCSLRSGGFVRETGPLTERLTPSRMGQKEKRGVAKTVEDWGEGIPSDVGKSSRPRLSGNRSRTNV